MFKVIQEAMDAQNLPSLKLLLSQQPDLALAVCNVSSFFNLILDHHHVYFYLFVN